MSFNYLFKIYFSIDDCQVVSGSQPTNKCLCPVWDFAIVYHLISLLPFVGSPVRGSVP